jgi:uncharacterized protein (DUF58 family)
MRKPSIHWGIVVLFIGLIAVAVFSRVEGYFFVLYGLGGVFLVSWIWLTMNLRGLSVSRKHDDHAYFGQKISLQLEFHNRSFWPILWLRIDEHLPIELSSPNFFRSIVSLAPRERIRLSYQLHCRKRGYYSIGPLEILSGGFWGIFEGTKHHISSQRLVVYPRIVPITHLSVPSQTPIGSLQSPNRLIEDPSRLFGVRPYISGDSLRKIDWKTTASTNSLQVKRFQSSISLDAHLFLNLNQQDYEGRGIFSATELGITIAASLAVHLSQQRQSVGLTVLAEDPLVEKEDFFNIPMGKGNAHLMQLLELLARVQRSRTSIPFDRSLPGVSSGLPWGTIAFVITPIAGGELFEGLLALRRRGIQPVLILTQTGAGFRITEGKAREIGVPCFRIEKDRDLDVWREERSQKVRRLSSMEQRK